MTKKYLLSCLLLLFTATVFSQNLTVEHLSCENKTNPWGVEQARPVLSWFLKSGERGVLQTAYRVLVSDDPEKLQKNIGNIWDSKMVQSSASIQVYYAGTTLLAAKHYFWKVMIADNKKHLSKWSEPATWQMGLLTNADWKGANWIAYDRLPDSNVIALPTDGRKDTYTGSNILPLLRKGFTISKPIKSATMFICGLGHFEMNLNGKKVADHFLDPGWTKYDKQGLYVGFDLTSLLEQGQNAVGVILGNGFYYVPPVPNRYRKLRTSFGFPKMIARLVVEYQDGTQENIVSDESWRTAKSPITFSSIFGGEDYDATLEQAGWDAAGFNDASWKQVIKVDGPPVLNSQFAEPLKVMETFLPKKISAPSAGTWVYDLGQNASGIPEITVQGKRGDTIKIIPGELLKEDGTANQRASGGPFYFQYVLKGGGPETWRPRFTYYGHRYLQINGGVPAGENNPQQVPVLLAVKGLHTRNAAESMGSFTCSNDLFNKTFTLIDWAIKSNIASLFTDCPHREKLGWLEEAHLMGNSVRYNYEINSLCKKQILDMAYSQTAEGLIPEIAPEYVKFDCCGGIFRDSPEWGGNAIIMPWYMYEWYGDKKVLEDSYSMMTRYAAYLETKAKGHILSQGLGDWYDIGPKPPGVSQLTPMGITGTAIYYYSLTILAKTARLLNKQQDAAGYEKLSVAVRKAFNEKFFNRETKQYGTGSQTANAMAVFMKLVDPKDKEAVVDNIVKDIRSRNNSLTAGDIGYRYLLKTLQEENRSEVIFDMNSRADVPGYGYQLAKGATALTESWQAFPTVSNNHFMLGHLMEWFYCGLGGINQSDKSVAYKEIVIKPELVGDVTSAATSYQSMYGTIITEWKKQDGVFTMTVTIPGNTKAVVYLPAANASSINEGGKPLNMVKDIQVEGSDKGKTQLKLGSGVYRFEVK